MKTERGFSLVEILVVTAILTVTLGVMASVFHSQQRVSTQLADKLASLDLARTLTGTLAGGGVCSFMIGNAPQFSFNPTADLSTVVIPPYPSIPSRPQPGAVPALVADGVTPAAPNSPRLLATSIQIQNLQCAILPCTPATTQFNANLVVTFDNTRTAAQIAPLLFPIVLTTTPAAGQQRLTSCTMNGAGGGGAVDMVIRTSPGMSCIGRPANPSCPALPVDAIATCPAGYQVSGCGYELGPWPAPGMQFSGDATPGDDYYTNSPATMMVEGNGCKVVAGQIPACNICFRAHATCIRIQ